MVHPAAASGALKVGAAVQHTWLYHAWHGKQHDSSGSLWAQRLSFADAAGDDMQAPATKRIKLDPGLADIPAATAAAATATPGAVEPDAAVAATADPAEAKVEVVGASGIAANGPFCVVSYALQGSWHTLAAARAGVSHLLHTPQSSVAL